MLALCAGINSCSPKEQPLRDTRIPVQRFNLTHEAGQVEVKFTPNSSWTAFSEDDFITFDPKEGTASAEEVVMTVFIAQNDGDARTAKIVVSFETNDVEITINQDAKEDEPILDQTEYTLPAEGGDVVVEFTPGSDWTAACDEKWVVLSTAKGSASESKVKLTISVAKNTEIKERTAEVLLALADQKVKIKIIQAAGDNKVTFAKTEYSIGNEGGDIKIEFLPLTKWTASTEDDFIAITPAEGEASTKNEIVTLTVSASQLEEMRTGTVIFKFENNEVVVTVNQEGCGAKVEIDKTQYDVSYKGEMLAINFIPKTAWTATANKTFVELAAKSGEASADPVSLEVKVKENTSTKQRSATLKFTFENNIVEILISQEARPENTRISKTSYEVDYEGGLVTVSFTPTTNWIAESDETFLSLKQLSGDAGVAVDVEISVRQNYSKTTRQGQVTFVFETNEVIVTITQKAEDEYIPSEPEYPDNPDTPDKPNDPDVPSDPDDSSKPDNPNDPDDPSNPSDPSDPSDPSGPSDQDTPGDMGDEPAAGTEDVNKGEDIGININ